jgi:DNA-binding CsgD family transcriptional regulator
VGDAGVHIAVTPLDHRDPEHSGAVVRLHLSRPGEIAALSAFLVDRGLTPAERALCHHLLRRGTSLETFARLRGTRIGTVRHQIKQVMSKLGVNSQLDVVRLLYEVTKAGRPPGSTGQVAE